MGAATGTVQWFYNNNRFGSEPQMLNPEYISVTEFNFLNSSKSWEKLQKKSIVATEATMTTL